MAGGPSAAEQAEISRFGMFNEEEAEQIAARETVKCCQPGCGEDAWWTAVLVCCGQPFPLCTPHADALPKQYAAWVRTAKQPHCLLCDVDLLGLPFEGVYRMVEL